MIFTRLPSGELDAATFIAAIPKTTLCHRLARIGAKIARNGWSVTLRTAEAMVPRQPFADILALNSQLRTPPVPA
jgi:hypothetical protein